MEGAEAAILQRALRYPFEAPEGSFVLAGGRARPAGDTPAPEGREPLLAYGANRSPGMLAAKLGTSAEPLLAERVSVPDHDIVYSAHVSPYGAVPATILPCPGATATASVLHLTPAQRRALDATELNYEIAAVAGLPAYVSRHGALELDGSPIALAAVSARGRTLPELDEPEVLERVAALLAPGVSVERFVLDAAAAPAQARRWTEQLRSRRSAAG
jgi:hypothetical protein